MVRRVKIKISLRKNGWYGGLRLKNIVRKNGWYGGLRLKNIVRMNGWYVGLRPTYVVVGNFRELSEFKELDKNATE